MLLLPLISSLARDKAYEICSESKSNSERTHFTRKPPLNLSKCSGGTQCQNRTDEVRRDPWRSSSPIPLLKVLSTRAGHSGQCPIGFQVFQKTETPQPLRATCSSLIVKKFFLCLNGISSISICVHCPFTRYGWDWLYLLYILLSSIYAYWQDP